MQDRKYAAIQFTIKDFDLIRSIQARLNNELGLKLSQAQTVMYCVDRVGRLQAIKDRVEEYEKNSDQGRMAEFNRDEHTATQPMLQIRSSYIENQSFPERI